MSDNGLLKAIYERRSIRVFSDKEVDDASIMEIIKAGSFAPSGLNNQPWRFITIRDTKLKNDISTLTHYSKIVVNANVLIAVLLDKDVMYNRDKDVQAIGACIQNMLLAVHVLDLGAVWLGEILNQKDQFHEMFSLDERYELMAVVAIGHKTNAKPTSTRKDLSELIIKEL
jgi:nitroreductase